MLQKHTDHQCFTPQGSDSTRAAVLAEQFKNEVPPPVIESYQVADIGNFEVGQLKLL